MYINAEELISELRNIKSNKNKIIPLSSDVIFKNVFTISLSITHTLSTYCPYILLYINPEHPKCFREEGESARQSGIEWGIGIFFTVLSTIVFSILLVTG